MVGNHNTLFVLFPIFAILLVSVRSCDRTCPGAATLTHLSYPFGFSQDCEIRLNCTNSSVQIGEFSVYNISSENILVRPQAACNRSINSLLPLFGDNFGITWGNGLLLQDCSAALNGCVIPSALLESQYKLVQGCDHAQCYSKKGTTDDGFMAFANVTQSGCKHFYSSVAVAAGNDNSASVSLEFQTVQLGWWLEGDCNCSELADCKKLVSPVNRRKSFRCQCKQGFMGDGFKAGDGCRKVSSHCNPTKYLSGNCEGNTKVGILIGGVVAGAILVIVLVILFFFLRRRSYSDRAKKCARHLLSETAGGFSVLFYTYKEIERATYNFSEKHRLGVGAYGTVYGGKLRNDEWVAIKRIRYRDRDGVDQVMNEIKLLSTVSHPNLVRLLGFCLEKGEQILVYEFMPNGTLSQHLHRERGIGLPWTIRLNIASETAQAIAHLHSSIDPPIYHRDIKSSNILLDHNFSSKVADFGLSRLGMVETSHISTAPQGTPGYLDPQYHQSCHLSDKSDVYSFGVVLAEIITAMRVVDFTRPQNEVNLASLAVEKIGSRCLDEIIDPFLEPHRDAWTLSSIHKVSELAFRCLAFHRDMRPSMKEVAAELEQIKLSGWAPLEENICEPSSVSSFCSSPSNGNDMSKGVIFKTVGDGRSLTVPHREDFVISTTEVKDFSPVSVQDPWLSEQSSPSSNSLLGNASR